MLVLVWTVIALEAIGGTLAALVSRRNPAHRIVAAAMLATCGAEIGRYALVTWVLPVPPPEAPLEGALRLAIYLDRALFLVWRTGVAAVALRVFARRPAWVVLPVYALAVAVLSTWYPYFRYDNLRKAYLGLDLIASFVAVGSAMTYARRRHREKHPPSVAIAAVICVAGHFVSIFFGPFSQGLWGSAWVLSLACNAVVFAALVVLYGGIQWNRIPLKA